MHSWCAVHRRFPKVEETLKKVQSSKGTGLSHGKSIGLRWTWHDTDPGVALRWLGVPGGSTVVAMVCTMKECDAAAYHFGVGHITV